MLNWKTIRESQWKAREERLAREMPLERELPVERGGHRLYTPTAQVSAQVNVKQMEFEEMLDYVDQKAAALRHKEAMARRWFGYYRKCKDQQKKMKLIDQYNFLAQAKRSR